MTYFQSDLVSFFSEVLYWTADIYPLHAPRVCEISLLYMMNCAPLSHVSMAEICEIYLMCDISVTAGSLFNKMWNMEIPPPI